MFVKLLRCFQTNKQKSSFGRSIMLPIQLVNLENWCVLIKQRSVLLNHGLKRSFLPHTFTPSPQA